MKVTMRHLVKKFGETIAVNDVSAVIESGQLAALLGPSGCGKTTTLNLLSGILPVTSGDIYFDEENVTDVSPDQRGIGFVFQNYALYPHMTVLENVCFPLLLQKVPKKERISRAMKYVEMVHIEELLQRKPQELSGGQQQRVAIARALVKQPRLLLLDEPLSNLDAKLRVEMREEIRRIQRTAGITTVFVTHDQEEASSIADQIMLMKGGVLQQVGAVQELYRQPANYFVADFLGAPEINRLHGTAVPGGIRLSEEVLIPYHHGVPEGTKVILGCRAEALAVNPEQPVLQARVMEIYTAGRDVLLRLEAAGQSFRAYADSEKEYQPGETISLGFRQTGVFLFDEQSGERYQ